MSFRQGPRDFIPAGEKKTPQESRRRGEARPDFVPGPGHKLLPPSGDRQEAGTKAIEAALSRQAGAWRTDYNAAVERLRTLTVAQAVDVVAVAPEAVREMLLVAETLNGQRKGILDRFGTPDQSVIDRYQELLAANPPDVSTNPPVSTDASAGAATTAPAADAEE